jgi:protein-S-isoprenylcysteine O-methyltransferase Ste14
VSRNDYKGTYWVICQCFLIGLTGVGWLAGPRERTPTIPGAVLAVACTVFAFWTMAYIRRSFTFFTHPRPSGTLIDTSPFRFIRHPIYTGALVLNFGQSPVLGLWGVPATVALVEQVCPAPSSFEVTL